jgi:hypothetical protein
MRIRKITVAVALTLVSSAAFAQQMPGTTTSLGKVAPAYAPAAPSDAVSNSPIKGLLPEHPTTCRLKDLPKGTEPEIVPQFECAHF